MPEKEQLLSQIVNQAASIIYIITLSASTGALGYLSRLRDRRKNFSFYHLLIAFCTGGLNGYFVFLLCDIAEWSWQLTAFLTGAAGAMGNEMFNALLHYARRTLNIEETKDGDR